MAQVQFPILIDEDKAQILQDFADINELPPEKILAGGNSVDSIVNDMVIQSIQRFRQKGVIPAEIKAEISAHATQLVAARAAGAA